jgi:hypothetical protein
VKTNSTVILRDLEMLVKSTLIGIDSFLNSIYLSRVYHR